MNRLKPACLLLGLLTALASVLTATPAFAHEGHDHGDEKKAMPNLGNTPQRLPDGVVFLPKTAQRQMGILTRPAETADVPRSIELPAQVIMDPQRGGRVQAMIAGRIEAAGANGLPATGSRVKKGEVLAWVVPAEGQIERAGQSALLAELKASQQLAEKRLARLQELADTVPGKEIDAAASEVASLSARSAAISHGVSGRDALVAPVSGVIAAANAVVGQVVDSRELVFEIIDPDSLHVEALAYETLAPGEVVSASLAVGAGGNVTANAANTAEPQRAIALNFIGAGRRLREQALPLIFGQRGQDVGLLLPLGQPVKIHVLLRSTAKGLPIPQQALVRSPANEPMVWVKSSPERFTPKTVRSQPLDGASVLITGGLADGDRVVTDGATLINQIR